MIAAPAKSLKAHIPREMLCPAFWALNLQGASSLTLYLWQVEYVLSLVFVQHLSYFMLTQHRSRAHQGELGELTVSPEDDELKAHAAIQGQPTVDVFVLRKLVTQGRAESFRLAVPTEANGRETVYAYLDEASEMKLLPLNQRASGLLKDDQTSWPPKIRDPS